MDLSPITRAAVLDAVAECDRVGRRRFLEQYGFDPARQYFLEYDGRLYDSKAIVGVAYGHATGRPLRAGEFSGGRATVGRVLGRLGFHVTDEPTTPVEQVIDRVRRLRVASTPDGPALHQPITLLWALGRAAQGRPRLVSWQEARPELRALLGEYGRQASRAQPEYPLLALARTDLWEITGYEGTVPPAHGEPGPWMDEQNPLNGLAVWVYELVTSSPEARTAVLDAVADRFFDGSPPDGLLYDVGLPRVSLPGPQQDDGAVEKYLRMCLRIEDAEARGDHDQTVRTAREQPVRSRSARDAVLLRSGGRCENPRCTGQPQDVTAAGEPLLEVDHVEERAGGGRDHPVQMIALCPNCHAVKTRGRTREVLRVVLAYEARERHLSWTNRAANT
ncbi:HNH endonuclease signature motif containing protein [Actinomadura rayongensis]|uniref:HNH nuclease domain-containing protein n=1 Tax=Actinomadura rayongensis TaxID=1429076 RepID=A0A6I4W9I6_9ACTN|nr:HNH endonuclease signature motif containing protein [Actinomadura rayongensis]MXQ65440.1 hypothetical protein [Actinomadura rayongensis]